MTFNLEQMKDLIYVANCFEEWTDGGKKEPIEITEAVPLNLWYLFRIYLLRFCDKNSTVILPPVKKIPADFLYGTFRKVEVSPATEFVSEDAFANAHIQEVVLSDKELNLYDIDYDKYRMAFGKIKALSAFESEKNIRNFTDVMECCNRKELVKKRTTVVSRDDFLSQCGKAELDFTIGKSVLIFDTGLQINTHMIKGLSSFKCYAFLFESNDAYLFLCRPLRIRSVINKGQLPSVPFILEKWMEELHKESV